MATKTISKPSELVGMSDLKIGFNPCTLGGLFNIEYHEFRKCLGVDFRTYLLGKLVDYTTSPNLATAYENPTGTGYDQGALVIYKRVIYKSLQANNTALPSVVSHWEKAPKFSEPILNEFYCMFLGPYIALSVICRKLPYIITQITDKGALEYNGQNWETTDQAGIERLRTALYAERAIIWGNLEDWITNETNSDNEHFSTFPGNVTNDSEGCGCGCGSQSSCGAKKRNVGGYNIA